MRISPIEQKEFIKTIKELLEKDQLLEMTKYIQHGNTTTFSHCLIVSYYSYALAQRLPFNFDTRSLIRGAMLHDFYLYDWHIPHPSHKLHGFVHPGFALKNAKSIYQLNTVEQDIIEKHMWPMTIHKMPQYRESLMVCSVDKIISLLETFYIPCIPKDLKRLCNLLTRNAAVY